MQPQTSPPVSEIIPERYVRLLVWAGAALLGILLPLKILSLGYLPADDAMRHVAKAISGKPWAEILVMDERFAPDEHPGWHAILGALHRWLGFDADTLIGFSVVVPFVAVWAALLAWRRRPEAVWLVWLLAALAAPASAMRVFFGRPFIVMLAVYVLVLQFWTRGEKIPRRQMLVTTLLIGFSVWVHGSWYLFGLLPVGFALAGQWRKSFSLGGCAAAGAMLGAVFTGRPLGYLQQTFAHLLGVFGGPQDVNFLVTELRPDPGDWLFVAVFAAVVAGHLARGGGRRATLRRPLLALALLGWLLGLKVSRFWTDWGMPAALLWLAAEAEGFLEARLPRQKLAALALAGAAAAGIFFTTTRNVGGRWTANLKMEFIDAGRPELAGWLPDPGGLIYSADMNVFFRTFYKNPQGDWRYVLGFEPGVMRAEDFAVLRGIQQAGFVARSYAPWLLRMRPEDRMIFLQEQQPGLLDLEWKLAARETWIGRWPRKAAPAR